MYKVREREKSKFNVNNSTIGESIEQKVRRITETNEPIKDGVEMIYTERKDKVLPQYNIRTDRFEIALDAFDKIAMSTRAHRDRVMNEVKEITEPEEKKPDIGE